jgi:hypothetical protein
MALIGHVTFLFYFNNKINKKIEIKNKKIKK